MSESFEISCAQCKESFGVGQAPYGSGDKGGYLYTAEGRAIWLWLRRHQHHPLVFHGQEYGPTEEFICVEFDKTTGAFETYFDPANP